MIRFWGQDAVSVGADGRERPIDHDMMRKMRGFEKGMRTRWTFEIQQVSGADVTVSLSETSDFYDLLGVGKCTQVVVYTVRDRRVVRSATKTTAYEHGEYRPVVAAFRAWLLKTPAIGDSSIIREGQLQFTRESAGRLLPWLRAWRRQASQP